MSEKGIYVLSNYDPQNKNKCYKLILFHNFTCNDLHRLLCTLKKYSVSFLVAVSKLDN